MSSNPKRLNRISEDIYDYLKATGLSDNQNDEWAKLSRKFEQESKRNLKKLIRNKTMEWNPATNEIRIGKYYVLKLEYRKG